VDSLGLVLAVVVTAAHIQDRDGAHRLLTALRARFSTVTHIWADGGYAGRLLPWARKILALGVKVIKTPTRSPDSSSCPDAGS
jgi:transposase